MENISSKNKYPVGKIGFLWMNMKGYQARYIIALFGTVLYNIMQLIVPYFSGRIIDDFLTGAEAAYNREHNLDTFIFLVVSMVVLTITRCIIVYFVCAAFEAGSQSALYRIRNFLFNKIERQDMQFFATYRTGDLMTRVTGDLDAMRHMIAWVVRMIIQAFALVGSTLIYFFVMNWKLALCMLAIAPLLFLIVVLFKNKVGPKHVALREKLAAMNTDAQENISGNRVVKAFAREDYEIEKFEKCNREYMETNKETGQTWIKFFPAIETFANLLPFILMLVGGIFLINGELTMGEYVAFSGLTWAIAGPMRMLGDIMNEFQRFSAASEKVMEIYYSTSHVVDPEFPVEMKERLKGRVVFDHVSFEYKDEAATGPVLHDISFTAEPGETVAIMGETGCGKTSLIQLIPRFYDPIRGSVSIDGVDVRDYKLKDLRSSIGLATQDVLLYSDTIDGNIAYGDSNMQKREVIKYAKYSQADDFIDHMPEGYDTIIGERGVGLSGGQKQRISLARALAVKPSVLILDDTTSAVDLETEKKIQDGLDNLDFDCTKIIIAQRVSTTKRADKILILKDGRIIEAGSHDELVALGGYYADVVKLQAGI